MHDSIVVDKLKKKKPILTVKSNFGSPAVIEMIGTMGFDCVWICNEHLPVDESRLAHLTLAARATGMDIMLRRNISGYDQILRPLEMGIHGFMIPRVTDVDYLKRIVEYAKFPPKGKRGLDGVNADADFGLIPLDQYLSRANEQTFLVAQIEDSEAIPLIDEIAGVEGVDILFVGPADLSMSLGVPGELQHQKVMDVIRKVGEACDKHGTCAGTPALSLEHVNELMSEGYRFFTTGGDYGFVKAGLLDVKSRYAKAGFDFSM